MLPPHPSQIRAKKSATVWTEQPLTRKDFLLLCGGAIFSTITVFSSVSVIGRVISANYQIKYSIGRYGNGKFL